MQKQDFCPHRDQISSGVFRRFYNAVDDAERLYAAYDALLKELWMTQYWDRGQIGFCRILWSVGRQARSENRGLGADTEGV